MDILTNKGRDAKVREEISDMMKKISISDVTPHHDSALKLDPSKLTYYRRVTQTLDKVVRIYSIGEPVKLLRKNGAEYFGEIVAFITDAAPVAFVDDVVDLTGDDDGSDEVPCTPWVLVRRIPAEYVCDKSFTRSVLASLCCSAGFSSTTLC